MSAAEAKRMTEVGRKTVRGRISAYIHHAAALGYYDCTFPVPIEIRASLESELQALGYLVTAIKNYGNRFQDMVALHIRWGSES